MDLVEFGSTDPIPFKLTLNGVAVTGITFDAADVTLSKDGAAFTNIGANCTEVGQGWYIWTPSAAADTQCNYGIINVVDSSGSAFDETGVLFYTGGNAGARFNG